MKKMGYDFKNAEGLNFGRVRRSVLKPFAPKGKPSDYYSRSRRGLGCITPPTQSEPEDSESLPSRSSSSDDWDSDVSIGAIFKGLSVNMTSASHTEEDENLEPFEDDTWAQQQDMQWKIRFKQREPPH